MRLVEIKSLEKRVVAFVNKLLTQLSSECQPISEDYIKIIINSPNSQLLFLVDKDDNYIGMISLGQYHTPSGAKAWIEDVVIDDLYSGRGFGRTMLEMAIEAFRVEGIQNISLTTNPKRIAANNLYKSLGFKLYDTNLYKMKLS